MGVGLDSPPFVIQSKDHLQHIQSHEKHFNQMLRAI